MDMAKISCGGFYIGEGLNINKDDNGRDVLSVDNSGGGAETLYVKIVDEATSHTDYTFDVYTDYEHTQPVDDYQLKNRIRYGDPISAVVNIVDGSEYHYQRFTLVLTSYYESSSGGYGDYKLYFKHPDGTTYRKVISE